MHATSLVLGKLSGRHAFRDKLEAMGYQLDDKAFAEAFGRFKDLADKKKHVFDEDIVALVDDEIVRGHDRISVKTMRVETGIGVVPGCDLTLSIDGREAQVRTTGDGPVDAIFKAIRELYPHTANPAALPDQCGHGRHGCAGHGQCTARREWAVPSQGAARTLTRWWLPPLPM